MARVPEGLLAGSGPSSHHYLGPSSSGGLLLFDFLRLVSVVIR